MKKKMSAALFVLLLVAAPGWAQSKLDKALEKAHEKLEDGKPDDAVKELTEAAEEVGAPGYMALGGLLERLSRLEDAGAAYEQALATATPAHRPDALARLAHFTLRVGPGREALRLANMAVEAGKTASTLAARARAQVRSLDQHEALASADEAVALDPTSPMARVARGEALFALGRNPEAEAALAEAIRLDPASSLAHARLARVQIALGRPEDAVVSARKAVELDESFGEGFAVLGGALLADNLNNWSEAIAQAQQGAFLDPQNPIVQTIVGRILAADGQVDQAVLAYRRALRTDDGFAPARLALVKAELGRGRREAALAEATKAEAAGVVSPEIDQLLAESAVRSKDYATALERAERAIEGMPGNADAWALLGLVHQASQRPDDAAEAYAKAVELAPQNFKFRTTYGLLLGMTGDLDAALEQLRKVVDTPGYAEADAWVNLGWVHRNRNEPKESIQAYSRALEIDPEQPQAHLGLGWAHFQTEAYEEAIASYQKAVSLDPGLAGAAYAGITWSYVYKGNAAKAEESLEKAKVSGGSSPKLEEYVQKVVDGTRLLAEERERLIREQRAAAERAQKASIAFAATRSQDPTRRAQGARDLAGYGGAPADVVDALTFLVQTDDSYDVRIAAAKALGSLGPGARKAIPNIRGILAQDPYTAPLNDPKQEELDMEMKDYDYRKALREALKRIEP